MRKINKLKKSKPPVFKTFLHRLWVGFWILLVIGVLGGAVWLYRSGIIQQKWAELTQFFHKSMGNAGFVLENEIFINGRIRTPMKDIKNALNVKPNQVMTTLDITQMQQNLKALPWVKEATVRRQLPNILNIELLERHPVACFQQKNKTHNPIDNEGYKIDDECPAELYLPIVVGKDANKYAPVLVEALQTYATLYERTISAVLIDGRRWNLYIDDVENGVIVLLPDTDLNASLKRLDKLQQTHQVLDKQIKKLDLRFEDKIVIEPIGKDAVIVPEKGDK